MRLNRLLPSLLLSLAACGGTGSTHDMGTSMPVADMAKAVADMAMCPAATDAGTPHSLSVKIELTDDGMDGVPFFTQNGSVVHVWKGDIIGKQFIYATAKGGDQVGNAKLIDFGAGTIAKDLTASFTTPAHYPNGPWEMGLYIAITPQNPPTGPQPGDLAAFDLTNPPACEPPVTGVSVRMSVKDADASVTMTNRFFIRF